VEHKKGGVPFRVSQRARWIREEETHTRAESSRDEGREGRSERGSTLDELAREGARRMLKQALEVEVAQYLPQSSRAG